MRISDEQVARVVKYLRSSGGEASTDRLAPTISPEFAERILAAMDVLPDVRQECVARARDHLVAGELTPERVADKVIARAVSDSIR